MSEIDDEIKRIQKLRENQTKVVFNLDKDDDKDQYDRVIDTGSSKDKKKKRDKKEKREKKDKKKKKSSKKDDYYSDEEEEDRSRVVAREFESYHIPKSLLNSVPIEEDDKEILKSKFNLPETVASKEDEYRSRWRKRQLEPTSDYDPFTGKGDKSKHKSYGEIIAEQNLLREEKDVMEKIRKIQEKEKEKQRQQKVNQDNNNNDNDNDYGNEIQPNKKFKSENSNDERKWLIKVYKDKKVVKEINIDFNRVLTLGRDPNRNSIVLDHESCSSLHATIKFTDKRPILIDLNSTNQTFLNNKQIKPQQPEELYKGDIIQFGGSTREYIIFCD